MKIIKIYFTQALFVTLLAFTSCSSPIIEKVFPTLNDGKYDSEFPYTSSSKQLEEISNSIKLINSIAFYTSYVFEQEKKIERNTLDKIEFAKIASEKIFFNNSTSGTATVILEDRGLVGLLTVAHIVNFPDTIVSYYQNPDGSLSPFVQSISIKTRQTNYVPDLPSGGELDIIIMDKNLDIALLGKRFPNNLTVNLQVFKYQWGNSNELEWGSFIYVFGFPMNLKMISKGIVSSPGREKHTFLIDAVFNRGSSGGIVLAIRDGVPNFELVGIVKSVPADFQYNVHPLTNEKENEFNPKLPYKGELYVQKEQIMRTGITKVIGIESVTQYLRSNKEYLMSKGYYFKNIF
jgi:hypothetical protein